MCGTKRGSCWWINFSFYPSWRYKHEYLYRIMEFITHICDSKTHPEATYRYLITRLNIWTRILRYIKWQARAEWWAVLIKQLLLTIISSPVSMFWLAVNAVLNVPDTGPGWSVVSGLVSDNVSAMWRSIKTMTRLSLDCVRLTRSLAWLDITFRAQTQLAPVNE